MEAVLQNRSQKSIQEPSLIHQSSDRFAEEKQPQEEIHRGFHEIRLAIHSSKLLNRIPSFPNIQILPCSRRCLSLT
jgi:hypothetical protein